MLSSDSTYLPKRTISCIEGDEIDGRSARARDSFSGGDSRASVARSEARQQVLVNQMNGFLSRSAGGIIY